MAGHRRVVDDARLGDEQAADRADVRFVLANPVGIEALDAMQSVRATPPLQLVERSDLRGRSRDDDLATALVPDPGRGTQPLQLDPAGRAQLRFQRARAIVEAAVDHAAVVAALVAADAVLGLEQQ